MCSRRYQEYTLCALRHETAKAPLVGVLRPTIGTVAKSKLRITLPLYKCSHCGSDITCTICAMALEYPDEVPVEDDLWCPSEGYRNGMRNHSLRQWLPFTWGYMYPSTRYGADARFFVE